MPEFNTTILTDLHDLKIVGSATRLMDNNLCIFFEESAIDENEINCIRCDEFTYALYERDNIPFILFNMGALLFNFELNAFDLLSAEQKSKMREYRGEGCLLITSKAPQKIIVQRDFTFDPQFAEHLRSCLKQQWNHYHESWAVRQKIDELCNFLDPEEMLRKSKLYLHPSTCKVSS